MKKIVLKDSFAFVYLNQSFYSQKSVLEAIETYKEFFKASTTSLGKYIVVKIENLSDHPLETIANEFSNYIISNEYQIKK